MICNCFVVHVKVAKDQNFDAVNDNERIFESVRMRQYKLCCFYTGMCHDLFNLAECATV